MHDTKPPKLNLQVGQTYLDRTGREVTIYSENENAPKDNIFRFRSAFRTYRQDGAVLASQPTDNDLISEKPKIQAHQAAGELPITMSQGVLGGPLLLQEQKRKPQTLRETIDGATGEDMHVWCKVADVRKALDDAERYRYVVKILGAYSLITHATDWFVGHSRAFTPNTKESADRAIDAAIKGAQS